MDVNSADTDQYMIPITIRVMNIGTSRHTDVRNASTRVVADSCYILGITNEVSS